MIWLGAGICGFTKDPWTPYLDGENSLYGSKRPLWPENRWSVWSGIVRQLKSGIDDHFSRITQFRSGLRSEGWYSLLSQKKMSFKLSIKNKRYLATINFSSNMGRYIDLILTVGIMLGFIIWLIIMSKRKSKYGLNFKRVYCPVCGNKQPMVRVPKNQNQILYGGNTCSKCQAELDKYGNVIS